MFRFPFGTTQELNLDWFLEQWEIFKQEAQTAFDGIDHALDDEIQRVEDAMTDLYAARDAAIAAKNDALDYAQSANSSAIGASQSAQNSAASAVTSAQQAQSAAQSATSAQSSATNAGTSAGNALTQAQQSEAWATGEIGGVHVPPTAPQNLNNAKQYATNAQLSANAANTAKNDARAYSQDSKAWSTGIRDGQPVTSEDETYQNNAKYYAESISGDAAAAAQSASAAAASAASVGQSAAQIAQNTADIKDLKNSLTGYSPVSMLSEFIVGAMAFTLDPHIDTNITDAVASTQNMKFDEDTILYVDADYQTMRYYYDETTQKWQWTEPWSAGNKIVEANKIWGISIRNGRGGTTANIQEFTSKVTIKNVIGGHTDKLSELETAVITDNNQLLYDLAITDENGVSILECKNGHIKTKYFDSEKIFANEYNGKELPFGKHYYSSEKYMVMNYTPEIYIEAGACFDQYYFQFSENMQTVGVFNLSTKQHLYTWRNQSTLTSHCNSVSFGCEYYDEDDYFPLIYVSDERSHTIHVFRITESNSSFDFTLVQTITFGDSTATGFYYPNYNIDIANEQIIAMGYDTSSPDTQPEARMIISIYNLPKLSDGNVSITESEKIKTFKLRNLYKATQGGFAINGVIYQVFGFYDSKHIRAIDTKSERLLTEVDITSNIDSEPESLFVYDNDLFVASQDLVITKLTF